MSTLSRQQRVEPAANFRLQVPQQLIRNYGHPPDLQAAAVQNVLQQAEALSTEMAA